MYSLDNRHSLALPYWARPGLRLGIDPDGGGGNDDGNDNDDEDDDENDDEDDDEDDPDEGKSVDDLRAELKSTRAAIAKANGSSAAKRAKIKELKGKLDKAGKPGDDGKPADDADVEARIAAARAEGKKDGDRNVMASKAETALVKAGAAGDKTARLVRLLDFDDLEIDDDGGIDGLAEAIDQLRADYPELFAAKSKRRSTAGGDDRNGSERNRTPKTATERQAALILGKS